MEEAAIIIPHISVYKSLLENQVKMSDAVEINQILNSYFNSLHCFI